MDETRLPRHIAIIMDGNGRWAKAQGKSRVEGHEAGARGVRQAIEACREIGVKALSLYAFSTENWQRSKMEVSALFRLLSKYIYREIDELNENGIRIRFMGRMEGLPARAARDLQYCTELTKNNTALDVCVAINYGGRAELVDMTRAIASAYKRGQIALEDIDEAYMARHLYVPEHENIDLLIRTSGEMRISNFMLWQLSYAEMLFTPVYWPDFDKAALTEAIMEFQRRTRRFGGRP